MHPPQWAALTRSGARLRPIGSRRSMVLMTVALVIAAATLAALLFIAGAMWRARITVG